LLEGVDYSLVVGEEGDVSFLQHVAEMFHGFVDSQQFSVVGTILLLCRVKFLGKKKQGAARRLGLIAVARHPWRKWKLCTPRRLCGDPASRQWDENL
jgi:hypothetical protein